jgi:hypothetical protein
MAVGVYDPIDDPPGWDLGSNELASQLSLIDGRVPPADKSELPFIFIHASMYA